MQTWINHLPEKGNIQSGYWETVDLTDFPVDAWEPSLDSNFWESHKKLHIFVQRTHQGDGERLSESAEKESMVYVLEVNPAYFTK